MGNPLLNLEAALSGQNQRGSGKPGTFAVKKRWDDGEHVMNLSKLTGTNHRGHRCYIQKPDQYGRCSHWTFRERLAAHGIP
jgi:hypothetical protein